MRNLLLLTALSIFTFGNAQITTDAGAYTKPSTGDTMIEATFTPNFSNAAQFAMSEVSGGAMYMRKFKSDTKAMRDMAQFAYADSGVENSDATFGLAAGIGVENHWTGAERLSTYWGYQAALSFADQGNDVTSLGLGASLFLGADYYIVPNVYVGMEFGYGLGIASTDDGTDDVTAISFGGADVTGNFRIGFRL